MHTAIFCLLLHLDGRQPGCGADSVFRFPSRGAHIVSQEIAKPNGSQQLLSDRRIAYLFTSYERRPGAVFTGGMVRARGTLEAVTILLSDEAPIG